MSSTILVLFFKRQTNAKKQTSSSQQVNQNRATMDIASLLAEADEEVNYDKDEFEDTAALSEAIKQHESGSPRSPSKTNKSAASILQQAAQVIAKEEKQEAAAIFKDAAKDVVTEVKRAADPEGHAMSILVEASKEVQELHNLPPAEEASSESESERGEEGEDGEDGEYDAENNRDLIFACHNGELDKVHKLLKKDSTNIIHQDRHGWTGLHWAAAKGYVDIIEELVECRRKSGKKVRTFLHIPDHLAGWTALHVACVSNQHKCVEALLRLGASRKKEDRLKERPVDVLGSKRNVRAVRALLERKKAVRDTDSQS